MSEYRLQTEVEHSLTIKPIRRGLRLPLRIARSVLLITLCVCTAWLGGCGGERNTKPPAPVPFAVDTPQNAAKSVLRLLQAHLAALGRHDYAAADYYRDQIVANVAARGDILARYHQVAGRRREPDEQALRTLVENWGSIILYYADGLDFDQTRIVESGRQGREALVCIPARGKHDEAQVGVACLKVDDGLWQAAVIKLLSPDEALQVDAAARPLTPESRPADTQPAPTTRPSTTASQEPGAGS
jgi:hypothetical protein